eukprot:SAG31_NODE_3375_length_4349_cov_1.941176_1_plen_156_part_00
MLMPRCSPSATPMFPQAPIPEGRRSIVALEIWKVLGKKVPGTYEIHKCITLPLTAVKLSACSMHPDANANLQPGSCLEHIACATFPSVHLQLICHGLACELQTRQSDHQSQVHVTMQCHRTTGVSMVVCRSLVALCLQFLALADGHFASSCEMHR